MEESEHSKEHGVLAIRALVVQELLEALVEVDLALVMAAAEAVVIPVAAKAVVVLDPTTVAPTSPPMEHMMDTATSPSISSKSFS